MNLIDSHLFWAVPNYWALPSTQIFCYSLLLAYRFKLILLCQISNIDGSEPIRAERATVRFFEGLEVEGYRMPSGEFRVGLEGTSRVLGSAPNWLYRTLTTTEGKTLKTLQGYGFDAYTSEATVERPQGGTTTVGTIGLDSFNICIVYQGNWV